jgi:hypothetical protein
VVSFGAHPEIAVTAYQSIPGMFLHLFRFDTIWNRSPMLDVPALAVGLIVLAETAIVASTFWATARADLTVRPTRALALAAWVVVSIVASPASADYHYTLLIVPIALLVAASGRIGQSRRLIGALAIGAFLVAAPLPYKSPNLAIAGWSILAYPKLYGGLILWGITLATLRAAAYLPGVVWSASDPPMSRRSS